MFLLEKINNDLINALKSRRSLEVDVWRGLNAAVKNKVIENRGRGDSHDWNDDDTLEVLKKEAKKRREAIDLYRQGNRDDLADKEERELKLIEKYLPEKLSREAIEKAVDEVLMEINDKNNFGLIMKTVMAKLRGQADGQEVAEIIKRRL